MTSWRLVHFAAGCGFWATLPALVMVPLELTVLDNGSVRFFIHRRFSESGIEHARIAGAALSEKRVALLHRFEAAIRRQSNLPMRLAMKVYACRVSRCGAGLRQLFSLAMSWVNT